MSGIGGGRGGGGGAVFGGDDVDAAGAGVEGHGACALLRVERLERLVVVAGLGADDGEGSGVAIGAESYLIPGVETGSVRAVANFGLGELLAGLVVGDGHDAAVANFEDAVVRGVDGVAGGRLAAGDRPFGRDGKLPGVEAYD